MDKRELTERTKGVAFHHGADLVGIVRTADLPEHAKSMAAMLGSAQSVVVVAARHTLGALRSRVNQLAQFDTIHAYGEAEKAAHAAARFLESQGFPSAAVPAFIPIDMAEPKKGMRGEICWRRAGVQAGIGSYGENGLLVTTEFGSAVRLSGVVTSAGLVPDAPREADACDHCMRCVEACPAEALSGQGNIDKRCCGDRIFQYGFRFFAKCMEDISRKTPGELEALLHGFELRELWQTFMTGNYYYCFECQSQCPASRLPQSG